jgi:selenocysteine lyase/cysteine desulfurase
MTDPNDGLIYFDNAATSWPKPPGVAAAMTHFLDEIGANPGRSGHRLAIESSRVVHAAREAVARLFEAPDLLQVVFGAKGLSKNNFALLQTNYSGMQRGLSV